MSRLVVVMILLWAVASFGGTNPNCLTLVALVSPVETAVGERERPNPKALRLPQILLIDGRPVVIEQPGHLEAWWNAGPYPKDLPGMNARALAERIRANNDPNSELGLQVRAWLPFAAEWKAVYDYHVATNPPPLGVSEWEAKGYRREGDSFVRDGASPRPPRGNFTAPERAYLMRIILEKAEQFGFSAAAV